MCKICMKKHTTLTIDHELIERAKEKDINMSELAEEAIKDRLGDIDVVINTAVEKCEFCGKEGEKETVKDIKPTTNTRDPVEYPTLLVWLWPDEKWICNSCLREKSRTVPASLAFTK